MLISRNLIGWKNVLHIDKAYEQESRIFFLPPVTKKSTIMSNKDIILMTKLNGINYYFCAFY